MESDFRTQQWLHLIGLISVTLIGLFLSYLLTAPFLSALTSAVALAVVLMPLHRRVERRIKRAGVASGVTVALATAFLIGPAVMVSERILNEATSAARIVTDGVRSGTWRALIAGLSVISCVGGRINIYAAKALMKRSPKMTANWALAMVHSRGGIVHSFSVLCKIR
jgi:predicted PurR-regulated permease PerM